MCCRTHDEACYMHAAMMIRLSWHTHLNHVAHIQVISHTYEAYHKYTSERISHTYESYHIYTSHFTYIWVISQIYKWAYFAYIWVISHIYKSFHIHMSHITHIQVSVFRIHMSYITYIQVISNTYESHHIYTSHFTYIWVISHIHKWARCARWSGRGVMVFSHVWLDTFTCVTWLFYMCDTTHSQVNATCHVEVGVFDDVFICVTWLIHSTHVWRDSFICEHDLQRGEGGVFLCVTRLMCIWDMTRSYVWHVWFTCARNVEGRGWLTMAFACVTWPIHICAVIHSCVYVWRDFSLLGTWLIHTCVMSYLQFNATCNVDGGDVTHSYVWCDLSMHVTWLIHTCDVTHLQVNATCNGEGRGWLIHLRDVTYLYFWHDSFICVTWLIHVWHYLFAGKRNVQCGGGGV